MPVVCITVANGGGGHIDWPTTIGLVFLWDIRMGSLKAMLTGHTNVVSRSMPAIPLTILEAPFIVTVELCALVSWCCLYLCLSYTCVYCDSFSLYMWPRKPIAEGLSLRTRLFYPGFEYLTP